MATAPAPTATPAGIGRAHLLVCPPEHFDSHFLFNPWLAHGERVDRGRAQRQWAALVATLEEAGADVDVLEAPPVTSALCFTADGAFCFAPGRALILRNDGPRGNAEPEVFAAALAARGYDVEPLPPGRRLDGGNLLRLDDGTVLAGVKPGGTAGASERYLALLLRLTSGARLVPVPLADPLFNHLDTVVAVLGGGRYLVHRDGLAHGALPAPLADGDVIEVERDDALRYACNTVVVGDVVVTGAVSRSLTRKLEARGFSVACLDLSEFHKAGGGAKCLTLPLRPRAKGARR